MECLHTQTNHYFPFREAQNCRDKKPLIFFFAFLVLRGKLGKQSLRFGPATTFFFGTTVFVYQNKNPRGSYDPRETILYFPDPWDEPGGEKLIVG
jgi:hypothetical protein